MLQILTTLNTSLVPFIPTLTLIFAAITLVVATITAVKAIFEYKRNNTAKRFEIFQKMNERFDGKEFLEIRDLLDNDSIELQSHKYEWKHNFVGFFEETAMSIRSKVMSKESTYYMFGYYAIKCDDSINFWEDKRMLKKDSIYWKLFREFAAEMRDMENQLQSGDLDPRRIKL
jgi:hypothetical protein